MVDVKISELPVAGSAAGTDQLEANQAGTSRSITVAQVGTALALSTTYAPLASPVFTGDPQAPTPATADSDTSISTTAFVKAQGYQTAAQVTTSLGSYLRLTGGTLSGPGTLTGTTATFNSPDNLSTTNIVSVLPNNGSLGVGIWYSGVRSIATNSDLHIGGNGTAAVRFDTFITPNVDNTMTLGASSARWSVVYAGTGTINTSGVDEKLDIVDPSDAERKAAARIKAIGPKRYKYKDAVAAKGDGARLHFGFIAEDVRDALAAEGLDPWAYGMLCADPVVDAAGNAITRLGLRYDELHAFLLVAVAQEVA